MTITRAVEIATKIEEMFEEENIELLEGSMNEKQRFSLRAYHPTTHQPLFKAHAASPSQVKSLLANAAKHMKTGGMDKIRITVHDHKHGMITDHKATLRPDGSVYVSGPSPEEHFEEE